MKGDGDEKGGGFFYLFPGRWKNRWRGIEQTRQPRGQFFTGVVSFGLDVLQIFVNLPVDWNNDTSPDARCDTIHLFSKRHQHTFDDIHQTVVSPNGVAPEDHRIAGVVEALLLLLCSAQGGPLTQKLASFSVVGLEILLPHDPSHLNNVELLHDVGILEAYRVEKVLTHQDRSLQLFVWHGGNRPLGATFSPEYFFALFSGLLHPAQVLEDGRREAANLWVMVECGQFGGVAI